MTHARPIRPFEIGDPSERSASVRNVREVALSRTVWPDRHKGS